MKTLSNELITRAKNHLDKIKEENLKNLKESGVEDFLLKNKLITIDQLMKLFR